MPEIDRPFPVYSAHSRDLALFDDTTTTYVMSFYEWLTYYSRLRDHFEEHAADRRNMKSEDDIVTPEQAMVRFSDRFLTCAERLQTRLDAIGEGREPPAWKDEWLEDDPYDFA